MTVLEVENGQRVSCVVGEERRQSLPRCQGALIQADDALGTEVALRLAHAGCRTFVLFGPSAAGAETEVDWVLQDHVPEDEDIATACVDSLAEGLDLLRPGTFPESGDIVAELVTEGIEDIRTRLTPR